MILSIEQRLDILESREQIKELRAQYAWHAARGKIKEVVALFTEDAIFESWAKDQRHFIRGRTELEALMMAADMKRPCTVVPLIHNDIIEIDGDHASGTCVMQTPVGPDGTDGFTGYYHDVMRREQGRWLFSERRFYLYLPFYEVP